MSQYKANQMAVKIKELYMIVKELEQLYPGRHFTLDGHLVGSIGEVLAAEYYDLILLPSSTQTHDAVTSDNRLVQIKATQISRIGLTSKPDYLLVLKILTNGEVEEIYNGPGDLPWKCAGRLQKNGQRCLSLKRLKECMGCVQIHDQIERNT